MALSPGTRFGRCGVTALIGEGSMGQGFAIGDSTGQLVGLSEI